MGNSFEFSESSDGKIGILTLDTPGQKVNTLASRVVRELAEHVDALEQRTDLDGLLLRSGKPGQFIAGADLNELGTLASATEEQVLRGIALGHDLFDRISCLPFPTVALIDGACMGGGTELVLAMDDRIASNSSRTKIALPEVNVGLIPGWGGTQRLPRLVGIQQGIEMITSGAAADANKAVAIGLAFDSVPADELVEAGIRRIEQLRTDSAWERQRESRSQPLGMSEDQWNFTFAVSEGAVMGKTKGQYPAPVLALKAIKEGINLPLADGLQIERNLAQEIMRSPTAAAMIGVFFKNNSLGRDPGIDLSATTSRDVNRVGVLGAGLMGAGIAAAHARRGLPTTLVDLDDERIAAGLAAASRVVESRIAIGRATPEDLARMLGLLSTSVSHQVFSDCDVVVEAVTENEDLKTKVFGQVCDVIGEEPILASNTSTISITRMARSVPNPERFVGMHFFSPVDRMALVEVIRGEQTSDETVATTVKLARRIGKTPIVVNDCAGFLVNRLLMPYMAEAVLLLCEGADMDAIDKAATRFGMPVGPIALHDMVGIDVACFAGRVMTDAYSDRAVTTSVLDELVAAGRLGKKSGAGFRQFVGRKGRPAPDPAVEPILAKCRTGEREFSREEITDRLFLTMLLEGTRALEEGIVSQPAHVDMGMILGTGFPAFRGGLLGWCDSEGAAAVVERAAQFSELGSRFEPSDLLRNMASGGDQFYPPAQSDVSFGGEA